MHLRLCAILLVTAAGCTDAPEELPPVVASSKYIDYRTDSDTTLLCMEDLLAREDQFIERTAATLGVDVPAERIHYVWDSSGEVKPWSCSSGLACYRYREEEGYPLIVSPFLWDHHELAHAVEIPALGEHGSQILGEGLAEYLGSTRSSDRVLSGFPDGFKAAVADVEHGVDYARALHFVGSLFARHGSEKYRALRATMPRDADVEEFAAVFESIYAQTLDDALAEMTLAVSGVELPLGCAEGDAPELSWTGPGVMDTRIESTCGDGSFRFGTYDASRPDFGGLHAVFVVQIPEDGRYDLTVRGIDGESRPVYGALRRCSSDVAYGVGSYDGRTGHGVLETGKYALQIDFPPKPEARGEAMLRLEYIGPPPE